MEKHITWQETRGLVNGVEAALLRLPRGCHLEVVNDATTAICAWNKGSKVWSLCAAVTRARNRVASWGCTSTATWLAGTSNTRADALSRRFKQGSEYQLDSVIFEKVQRQFNFNVTIDAFARSGNEQVPRYFSAELDPKAVAVDAFQQDWTKEHAWANPPFGTIRRVLDKIEEEGATALLCLPQWETLGWWPLLLKLAIKIENIDAKFRDRWGTLLPRPRWGVVVALVRGRGSQQPTGWPTSSSTGTSGW